MVKAPEMTAGREYAAPKLVVYGDMAALTAGGSGMSDEGSMTMDPLRRP